MTTSSFVQKAKNYYYTAKIRIQSQFDQKSIPHFFSSEDNNDTEYILKDDLAFRGVRWTDHIIDLNHYINFTNKLVSDVSPVYIGPRSYGKCFLTKQMRDTELKALLDPYHGINTVPRIFFNALYPNMMKHAEVSEDFSHYLDEIALLIKDRMKGSSIALVVSVFMLLFSLHIIFWWHTRMRQWNAYNVSKLPGTNGVLVRESFRIVTICAAMLFLFSGICVPFLLFWHRKNRRKAVEEMQEKCALINENLKFSRGPGGSIYRMDVFAAYDTLDGTSRIAQVTTRLRKRLLRALDGKLFIRCSEVPVEVAEEIMSTHMSCRSIRRDLKSMSKEADESEEYSAEDLSVDGINIIVGAPFMGSRAYRRALNCGIGSA